MIFSKAWGNTECIFQNYNFQVNRITIRKGGFCSKHKHNHKYNMFWVETGKLKISVWKNDYDLVDETILNLCQSTNVKPFEYHQFKALENTVAFEIYYTEPLGEDIIRETVGGNE